MAARRPIFRTLVFVSGMLGLLIYGCLPVAAQKRYAPGISDSEIKIGQTMPYSGPASAYRAIGMAERAYLAMINDQGGINGRKINLVSVDDGYSPPKTFEVAFIFSSLRTPMGIVVPKYLNEERSRNCFKPQERPSGAMRSIFHGALAGSGTIR